MGYTVKPVQVGATSAQKVTSYFFKKHKVLTLNNQSFEASQGARA